MNIEAPASDVAPVNPPGTLIHIGPRRDGVVSTIVHSEVEPADSVHAHGWTCFEVLTVTATSSVVRVVHGALISVPERSLLWRA